MEDCLFCQIVEKKIPSSVVYEDDNVLAFLDIQPVNKGHVLIIPKRHHKNFSETEDRDIENVFKVAKKISKAVMRATGASSFNMTTNNGKEAGQIIFHTHVHIIPRFSNDGFKMWRQGEYENDEEKEKFAEEIKGTI